MIDWLDLTTTEILLLSAITFFAGLVRGFSGFALSALIMAAAVFILPPVALIPMMWWLEMAASMVMGRDGWREADRSVVLGLVIGSTIGVPIGLALTTTLPVETSKLVALALIITLALTQLLKIRIAALATRAGLYISGLAAGIVTGLAGIGGMVVAVYVLSQDTPARKMRAALVLFLFAGSITSMVSLLYFGVMTQTAILRGLAFVAPTLAGVLLGRMLFTPKYVPYYRPFCLLLLVGLASFGLVRSVTS